ncbi:MAG: thiamine pyrophosphate-dependent dehydrogenase E1 component subunit alpha [Candidatus Omnitrophica bacterium]|nr:thiamine pyrophosphate-dependent dehydrogenase E1 component subunit alpha [Candidatus Omnitrophota bacterium]
MEYSAELLKDLYRAMARIRYCEESLIASILNGDVRCPCHLYSGEEAVAVGICASLNETDYIFGNHRSHGHFLAKGGGMKELVAEIYCKETGCSRGRGGSMHLIDPDVGMMGSAPIVAGIISLALGAALAVSIRKDNRVAVCFFGDGAAGEGVLYESLNFAALKKLPIIFVCENNLYATHMPVRECRVENNIYKIAEPFFIESRVVDGNNVLKVYEAGRKAVDKCRLGEGPVFLELLTYRFRGHVGADDNIHGTHTDIRPKEEIEAWFQKDPIRLFENYLSRNKLVNEEALSEIRREVRNEVEDAHIFARSSPAPDRRELTKYVYR